MSRSNESMLSPADADKIHAFCDQVGPELISKMVETYADKFADKFPEYSHDPTVMQFYISDMLFAYGCNCIRSSFSNFLDLKGQVVRKNQDEEADPIQAAFEAFDSFSVDLTKTFKTQASPTVN